MEVIIVGAGFASQTHWIPELRDSDKFNVIGVVDVLPSAQAQVSEMLDDIWTTSLVHDIPQDVSRETIVFVVTPDHYEVVAGIAEQGFKNLVVEKPLVSRDNELEDFKKLERAYGLRVYALDHYLQKAYSLRLVLGLIETDDPRNELLEIVGDHALEELPGCLGKIQGATYANIEAGDLAIPYLDKHEWLEHDPVIGGNIRDLGPHAFAPLVAAGLVKRDAEIWDAKLSKFTDDRSRLRPVRNRDEVEMYISTFIAQGEVSLEVTFGKVPISGGDRMMSVRGDDGQYFLELPRNGSAVVNTKDGKTTRISLSVTTNEFAVEEIHLFFSGQLPDNFDGHLKTSYMTLEMGMKVREKYFETL